MKTTTTQAQHTPTYRVRFSHGWSDGSTAEIHGTVTVQTPMNHRELSADIETKLNAHDELLAALEDAAESLEWAMMAYPDISPKSSFADSLGNALAAIAKVKGGAA